MTQDKESKHIDAFAEVYASESFLCKECGGVWNRVPAGHPQGPFDYVCVSCRAYLHNSFWGECKECKDACPFKYMANERCTPCSEKYIGKNA